MSGPADTVAVIGAGQMGLVLADVLAARGLIPRLWGHDPAAARALARTRHSPRRLPGFVLPAAVQVTGDGAETLRGATLAISAVPTQHVRAVWLELARHLPAGTPVVSVSKGIETGTHLLPTAVLREVLPAGHSLCVLSGPTIAAELARHLPATVVAASADEPLARLAQRLLGAPWLRVYRLDDALGVEIAGATKNVIALAAGMVDGLGAGYNAKSALLARGLAEIARLGVSMGARIDTFFGVAGVGDLATTCFSPASRNRTCGEQLGRGVPLTEVLAGTASVVEGVPTTRAVRDLSARYGVEMPITEAVHRILFEGLSPTSAIEGLMTREMKEERVG